MDIPSNSTAAFVANVIEKSNDGITMEMFLIGAVITYAEQVQSMEDTEENNLLINVANWQSAAQTWLDAIDKRMPNPEAH